MLQHGASSFTFHLKEGVLRIFITIKIIASARFEPATLGVQWQAR
jgi:hypothetical protein